MGSGNVIFIGHVRPLTWKLADSVHWVLEFGETPSRRSELDAWLQVDGTVLVSFRNSKTMPSGQPSTTHREIR